MQEANWGIFKAKFYGREQAMFEWLCYLLFCNQFGRVSGIARFHNQAGVETSPIEVGGDCIGWQAKFYESRLSEHKGDFIASITAAKSRHPEITKILFYTNLDFGQAAKNTDPRYKIEIENHARNQGVSVEWKTASFFESPFVAQDNKQIAQFFFSFEKGVINLIQDLNRHSETILNAVHSSIRFGVHQIKIDRSAVTEVLKGTLDNPSPLIVSGEGGVGKTAVIKDLCDAVKKFVPLFVFKATEFTTVLNLNDLFRSYGGIPIYDLVAEYVDVNPKCIVIDSAEKLSDIEDQAVFQEFLNLLLQNQWKIIFTTRRNYLDDLNYLLIHVYGLHFRTLDIGIIEPDHLIELSKSHGFALPANERLLNLIRNPFYLNEYLQNYDSFRADVTYSQFKNILWDKQIAKTSYRTGNTHIRRAECFLDLAHKRANGGTFFVKSSGFDAEILNKLTGDEVLGYDAAAGGYFIAHDIYEEWALERVIGRSFQEHSDPADFYVQLGSSLAIRRAFRRWLSDKLLVDKESVKALIERTIRETVVEAHWKDEVVVAVLLSEHSEGFFLLFESELLENNCALLVKITFLLRIACKEVDEEFMRLLSTRDSKPVELKTVLTKPRGNGWESTIEFIYQHIDIIGSSHMAAILPVLADWNGRHKRGNTTKYATLIALSYFEQTANGRRYNRGSRDHQETLIEIILKGAMEAKDELGAIVDTIVSEKEIDYGSKHFELAKSMLSSARTSFEIAHAIPDKLIQLAELFWVLAPSVDDEDMDSSRGIECHFGLVEHRLQYFPPSAFQTPTYQLLRSEPWLTIQFIVSFTNAAVLRYAQSKFDNEIDEITLNVAEGVAVTQYISARLWNMYRGTQVSTHLLESMHMALEKWLLEYAKSASVNELENVCLYLIRTSKSASITAVVMSVTFAQPYKLFNVAKVLFQTKELFLHDTNRFVLDQTKKSSLLLLNGYSPRGEDRIFESERIEACDEPHRQQTLEGLAVSYQLFGENEQIAKSRQREVQEILDRYYERLPTGLEETEADKTWRLYLARMDRRRMNIAAEQKGDQVLISLNPELDPELKQFSEDALKVTSAHMKYVPLKLWANNRWERNEDKNPSYEQYDGQPQRVLEAVRDVLTELSEDKTPFTSIHNQDIPACACAVLVRDYASELTEQDRVFCKDVLLGFAARPLRDDYDYQIGDGIDPAIGALPLLLDLVPPERGTIKTLLFILLLEYDATDSHRGPGDYALAAILNNLWEISFDDAHSIFLGYLLLKPKYDDVLVELRQENYRNNIYRVPRKQVLDTFYDRYGHEMESIVSSSIGYDELQNIIGYDLKILVAAFQLVPLKTQSADHQHYVRAIITLFAEKLLRGDDLDYTLTQRFLDKLAYFVLTSKKEAIEAYLKPLVDGFSTSEAMADLFNRFVYAEDRLAQYEEFWEVWHLFYGCIVKDCQVHSGYRDTQTAVRNYLLAGVAWTDDAKSWHSLRDKDRVFFKKVADDIGSVPAVLYSLSKLLHGIGSDFIDDGIIWISDILEKHTFSPEYIETNTVYYLENIVRGFIYRNRTKIRKTQSLKKRILKILDFLIASGSVVAYLTREDIL